MRASYFEDNYKWKKENQRFHSNRDIMHAIPVKISIFLKLNKHLFRIFNLILWLNRIGAYSSLLRHITTYVSLTTHFNKHASILSERDLHMLIWKKRVWNFYFNTSLIFSHPFNFKVALLSEVFKVDAISQEVKQKSKLRDILLGSLYIQMSRKLTE